MRYKAGDRVRVRKDLVVGNVYGGISFNEEMSMFSGKIVEISKVYTCYYRIRNGALIACVWTDSMLEPITDLTAAEVLVFADEMCSTADRCYNCPVSKLKAKYNSPCDKVKREHTDEFIDTVTKWVAGDAGKKKEIETECCAYAVIKDRDGHIVCEERIRHGDSLGNVFELYCKEHDGDYYAVKELRAVIKED